MYLKVWEIVLLEWVNCLKLSSPIQNLQDLKDGNFFTNLLQLLIPVDSIKSQHILARLYEFLRKHYPHFSLNYGYDVNIRDLSSDDLIVISSLLLHYSCIHDRRDVLTSPLCYQLSKTTQTSIKVYLEKTTNDITRDCLFDVIETCVNSENLTSPSTRSLTQQHYSNNSSPLSAIFQTPITKVPRLRQKDQEINKLRSELDLERFEKIDLQKELTGQKERNKKLSQQIHKKTSEITKLHNDISELESQLASNNYNNAWSEAQQKLRKEINSLEQYISQLHREQEQLLEEKDKIKDGAKQLQRECNIWKEQAISFESKYENLSDEHASQECDLENVRRHCTELTTLLKELQFNTRSNDTYEESDVSVAGDCPKMFEEEDAQPTEDLACAVIEVQLRDVQKENIEFKELLEECQQNISKLNNEIYNFKIKIKQLEGDKEILESTNQDLQSKLTLYIKTKEMLDKTKTHLEQTTIKLQDALDHNEFLTSNVIIKDKQLLEAHELNRLLSNSVTELTNDHKVLSEDHKNLQSLLRDTEEQLRTTRSNFDSVNKSYTEAQTNIEAILEKFELFVFGSSKLDVKDFQGGFATLLTELESDRARQQKDKALLNDDITRLEKLVAMQKTELVALNEQRENNLTEIETLNHILKATKEEVSVLEETITGYVEKIKSLNSVISEMKIVDAELNIVKVNLEEKIISLESRIRDCNNNEEIVKNVVTTQLGTDITDHSLGFDQYLKILQIETKNLIEKVEILTKNLDEAGGEIAKYKLNEEQLQKKIEEYLNKLHSTEAQHEEVKQKLRASLKMKKKLRKEFSTSKTNYEKEILGLQESLYTFEQQVNNLTTSELSLKKEIDDKRNEIKVLNATISLRKIQEFQKNNQMKSYQNDMKSLRNENDSLRAKNKDFHKECSDLENTCQELQNHIRSIVNELSTKNEELNTIVANNNDYKQKSEARITTLEAQLDKSNIELDIVINLNSEKAVEFQKKISDLTEEIQIFANKEKEYISELNETKDELNVITSKYTETLQAYQELQVESEAQMNNLTENLHDLIKKYNSLDNTHQEVIKDLNNLQNALEESKQSEIKLKDDIRNQQVQFEDMLNNNSIKFNLTIKHLQEKEEGLERELATVTDQLQFSEVKSVNLRKKLNEFYNTYSKLKYSFDELKRDTHLLSNNSCTINEFKNELSLCLSALTEENNCLQNTLQHESQNIKSLLEKLNKKEEELTLFREENNTKRETLAVVTDQNEKLKEELLAGQNIIESLNTTLNTLEVEIKTVNEMYFVDKKKLEETTNRLSSLEDLLDSKNQEVETLQSAIHTKTAEVEDRLTQNESLELELCSLKESFNSVVQKLNDLEEASEKEKSDFTEQNGSLTKRLFATQEDLKCLKEKIHTISAEHQTLEELMKASKENYAADRNTFANTIAAKLEEISSLEDLLNSKNQEIRMLQTAINTKTAEVEESLTTNQNLVLEFNSTIQMLKDASNKEKCDLTEQNDKLNKEIFVAQEDVKCLKEKINTIYAERQTLEEKITALNEMLSSETAKAQQKISSLEDLLNSKHQEIEILQSTVNAKTVEVENSLSQNKGLESELRSFQESFQTVVQKLNDSEKEKCDFAERNDKLSEELLSAQEEVEYLKEKVNSTSADRQVLEDEIKSVNNKYIADKNKLEESIKEMWSSEAAKIQEISSLKDLLKCKNQEIDVLHITINNKTTEVEDCSTLNNNLYIELSSLKESFNTVDQNLKDLKEVWEKEICDFTERNNKLNKDLSAAQEEVKTISSERQTFEEEINAINEGKNKLEATKAQEIDALQSTVNTKTNELENCLTHNKTLEVELSYFKESFNSVVQKLKDLEELSEKEKADLMQKIDKLSKDLSSTQKEVEYLKEKVKTVFAERQALELEINVANEKITEYESYVRKRETDIGEANRKLVTKLEENFQLEKCKQALQVQIEDLTIKINEIKKEKEDDKRNSETKRSALETDIIKKQNALLQHIEALQTEKDEALVLLEKEKLTKETVTNQNSKLSLLVLSLQSNIQNLIHTLSETPFEIENNDAKELNIEELDNVKAAMEMLQEKLLRIKDQNKLKIEQISLLEKEKQHLIHAIQSQNIKIESDMKHFETIQVANEVFKAKYDQLKECQVNDSSKTSQLEEIVSRVHSTCELFAGHSTTFKTAIDKLITERNFLENVIGNLRQNLLSLQARILQVNEEREAIKLKDQIEAFEFIVEDLQKQFLQISKKVHTIILNVMAISSKVCDVIIKGKFTDAKSLFEHIQFEEELEKVTDCRNAANNLLEQMNNFEATLDSKLTKISKENILKSSHNVNSDAKVKDEDLKKKNSILKQRLTLSENAKGNLEKKIKQLRQENKLLQEKSEGNMEIGYKTLLQQHIELQEKLTKVQEQRTKLLHECETYKLKHEKPTRSEQDNKLEKENLKLREAYSNLMSDKSRLELYSSSMKKTLEERTSKLRDLTLIKEAYEKLLEENNTFQMELDTVKYKRNKDREALLEVMTDKQNLKTEYEVKLEKMKERTVQLYREEMNKENQKHQHEKSLWLKKITQLENLLEKKRCLSSSARLKDFGSGDMESCSSTDSFFITPLASNLHSTRNSCKTTDDLVSSRSRKSDDCKCATLPRTSGMQAIKENQEVRRNRLPSQLGENLKMEDEDDEVFNNKYLTDLKEGRCIFPSERESNVNRLSELKWRNSLYPPHLKSSYPAETQFSSPSKFKEEDIKAGVPEFDDSLSTKLIPGEKPRKKDIGTTSYKRPGPPTPSKNGGRMSLQGNEREVLREHNEGSKSPTKRNTPSRLKSLFMGRNLSTKDNSENQPGTPRSKRLSIFRKQK